MKKMGTELFFIYKKKIREEEDEEKLHWITKLHKKNLVCIVKKVKFGNSEVSNQVKHH
jgi:hypothetical protein